MTESILEIMDRLYFDTIVNYGKPPTAFVLGIEEHAKFRIEVARRYGDLFGDESRIENSYSEVPVVRSSRPGIDIGIPEDLAARRLTG